MHRRFQDAGVLVLLIVAGLVVAYVRHDLQTHHAAWESYEQFFGWWFTHTMGVMLFLMIAGVAIAMSHEFFLGSKFDDKYQQLFFYIVMAVLVASVCILLLAHFPISDD